MKTKYQPQLIEKKWQSQWEKDGIYSPDMDNARNPYYSLMMFPYPSAEGLHVGNMYAFCGADIYSRFMRMLGHDVFEPIGLDGFGIHSENYAIKINKHIFELSKTSEIRFYEQLKSIGNSFDWSRTVETYKPEYYKWTQWLFLKMYEKGLAYKAKSDVNWCPSCKTVLADEQVITGKCERCGTVVEKRELEQWFFKITDYADRLLKNLDKLDWSEKVKIAQRLWIGRSEGMLISFNVKRSALNVEVFTTRPETADGATFLVLAPEHKLVDNLTTQKYKKEVEEYVKKAKARSEQERISEAKDKTGVFTGSYVINPVTKKEIPVWIADYVLVGYGTGAIMAVPAADARDEEFARKFKLEIVKTKLDAKPQGEKKINYHLRDWLISRQRYWGPPIPIIYCDPPAGGCGTVPVPEEDLPVKLPYVEEFWPTGTGKSPLATVEEFYKVKCPQCGGEARRETDVSDTFLDSAWYFLRYPSIDIENEPFDKERTKKWLPVDSYIGGAEHSVLHLLYARFVTMVLHDMKYLNFEEPFTKFRAHGLLISEGAKMSKSKGNVVNPDNYIEEYGADTLRMYLMFLGPFDQGGDFRDQAIIGVRNFLERVWRLQEKVSDSSDETNDDLKNLNKTVKKVTEDLKNLRYNTAIAALMEWLNYLTKQPYVTRYTLHVLLKLLAPFAPHITEELWQKLEAETETKFKSIHLQSWPKYDEKYLVETEINLPVQVNGKVRGVITIETETEVETVVEKARKEEKVAKYLEGKKYKTVYIKGKILNFITS